MHNLKPYIIHLISTLRLWIAFHARMDVKSIHDCSCRHLTLNRHATSYKDLIYDHKHPLETARSSDDDRAHIASSTLCLESLRKLQFSVKQQLLPK